MASWWDKLERRIGDLADDLLPTEYGQKLEQARSALEAGDWATARVTVSSLLEKRPDDATARTLAAFIDLAAGELEAARENFVAALALDPDEAEAHVGMGELELAQNDLDAAEHAFAAALARRPSARAHRGLGIIYLRRCLAPRARRELRTALQLDPDSALTRLYYLRSAVGVPGPTGAGLRRPEEKMARMLSELVLDPRVAVLARLDAGWLALAQGRDDAARDHFQHVLSSDPEQRIASVPPWETAAPVPLARLGLGIVLSRRDGGSRAALASFREALAEQPDLAEARWRVAEILLREDDPDTLEALVQGLRAGAATADPSRLRQAIEWALEQSSWDPLRQILAAIDPSELPESDQELRSLLAQSTPPTDAVLALQPVTPAGHVAVGRRLLTMNATTESERELAFRALGAARTALAIQPSFAPARRLEESAHARAYALDLHPSLPDGAHDLAEQLRVLRQHDPALSVLADSAQRALEDFQKPLLLTMMGEFSSGKSSLINAFLGRPLAPTGVTPTTATINVLRYGAEERGRIHWTSGQTLALPLPELADRLRSLDEITAQTIDHVELFAPLPFLEQVHLVDTPGFNSLSGRHAATARSFMTRADAVVWVFSASAAGRRTEKRTLDALREENRRVVAVINKTDLLKPEDHEALRDHLEKSLADQVDHLVLLSATAALQARQDGRTDPAWEHFERVLATRFFDHAQELKARTLCHHLTTMTEAIGSEAIAATATRRAIADQLREQLASIVSTSVGSRWFKVALDPVESDLAREIRSVASELAVVLAPSASSYGRHSLGPADRDYARDLLDEAYERLMTRLAVRLDEAIDEAVNPVRDAFAEATAADPQPVLDRLDEERQVTRHAIRLMLERALAFCQGHVRGGSLDALFQRELPRAPLDEDTLYHALFRDAAPLARWLDRELSTEANPLTRTSAVLEVWLERTLREVRDHEGGVTAVARSLSTTVTQWLEADAS